MIEILKSYFSKMKMGTLIVGFLILFLSLFLVTGKGQINAEKLAQLIDDWTSHVISFAFLAAAVGALSMVLIEVGKTIFFVRQFMHGVMVYNWIYEFLPNSKPENEEQGENLKTKADNAYENLLYLTCGAPSYEFVWLDQPTERMFAQMQGAGHQILDNPAKNADLYYILTREPSPNPQKTTTADDRRRLAYTAARRIEALQTRVEYWWARGNQLTAILISFILFWFFISTWVRDSGAPMSHLSIFLASLLGGVFAPLAKDLVTQLGSIRARRI